MAKKWLKSSQNVAETHKKSEFLTTWFTNAPLEILSSQRPGQNPVQIHQRPFHTRIKITKTKLPPPFASGIPLPEVLIPGFEMPTTTTEKPLQETSTEQNFSQENKVGDDVELNLVKPSRVEQETTTIRATATRLFNNWPAKNP